MAGLQMHEIPVNNNNKQLHKVFHFLKKMKRGAIYLSLKQITKSITIALGNIYLNDARNANGGDSNFACNQHIARCVMGEPLIERANVVGKSQPACMQPAEPSRAAFNTKLTSATSSTLAKLVMIHIGVYI